MKICIGLIVFNGGVLTEIFLKHYLDCPYVDYVVVAEGATQNMVDVLKLGNANSTDETIRVLNKYSGNPKLKFTFAKTPYREKLEQQNAYMDLVPEDTDYIWVADSDEFYHYSDILLMKNLLEQNKYTYASVFMYHFWKNCNTIGTGGDGWAYDTPIDRIFKYHKGAKFINHRPITILNEKGISVKEIKPLFAEQHIIRCWHYSYILYKNVYEKMLYYEKTFNRPYLKDWFYPVWLAWNENNSYAIESKYSIHPTVLNAKTKAVNLSHPIDIKLLR